MACVSKKNRDEPSYGFKIVPDSLDDITAEWCEAALKHGNVIGADVKLLSIKVNRLQNADTGVMDGGGLSGSTLARVDHIQYTGNAIGNEPTSLVCKLSLGSGYNMPLWVRTMFFLQMGGSLDEALYRTEIQFIEKVLPLLKDSRYKFPEIYFSGISDKGSTGFAGYVILDRPTKVKCVLLMEDMVGCKSVAVGKMLTKDEAGLCLKNVAGLHAKFWGDQENSIKTSLGVAKPEKDYRGACYSKLAAGIRNSALKSSEVIQSNIDKMFASEWVRGECLISLILNLILSFYQRKVLISEICCRFLPHAEEEFTEARVAHRATVRR